MVPPGAHSAAAARNARPARPCCDRGPWRLDRLPDASLGSVSNNDGGRSMSETGERVDGGLSRRRLLAAGAATVGAAMAPAALSAPRALAARAATAQAAGVVE